MYILWIRHGFSCANYLKLVDPWYRFTSRNEYDAPLTKLGTQQAQDSASLIFERVSNIRKKGKSINIVPIFFSSNLSRAIQTASNLKKGLIKDGYDLDIPLVVIPYVEEHSLPLYFDKNNKPRNKKELKDLGIKFSHLDVYDKDGNPKYRNSVKNFYKKGIPEIVNYLKEDGYPINSNSIITIVAHRGTIEEATGIRIGNVGAVLQKVVFNHKNRQHESRDSEIIFPGYRYEHYEGYDFIPDDLKGCRSERARSFSQ